MWNVLVCFWPTDLYLSTGKQARWFGEKTTHMKYARALYFKIIGRLCDCKWRFLCHWDVLARRYITVFKIFLRCVQYEPDIDEIRPGLWLGGKAVEQSKLEILTDRNIKSVLQIGIRGSTKRSYSSLKYKVLEVNDHPNEDMLRILQSTNALLFIQEALQRKEGVLVHCGHGVGRGATAVIAYLMVTEHLKFKEALKETMLKRKIVVPNWGFCSQLKALEKCKYDINRYNGPSDLYTRKNWKTWISFMNKMRRDVGVPMPKRLRHKDQKRATCCFLA